MSRSLVADQLSFPDDPRTESTPGKVDARLTVVSALTHSLGNLFSSARLAAPMLREDSGSPRAIGLLGSLEGAMERGVDLVDEIRAYLRYETADGAVAIRLRHLVEGVAKVARERAEGRCVFETSYAEDLPPVQIEPFLLFELLLLLTAHGANSVESESRIALSVGAALSALSPESASPQRSVEITLLHGTRDLDEAESRVNRALEDRVAELSCRLSCCVARVQTARRSGWKVILGSTQAEES